MNKKFYIADYCIIHVRKISNSQVQKIIIDTECKKNILKVKFLKEHNILIIRIHQININKVIWKLWYKKATKKDDDSRWKNKLKIWNDNF